MATASCFSVREPSSTAILRTVSRLASVWPCLLYTSMTKIIIAQRITSVSGADQIIIMDDGKVHASGSHEELLAKDPIYQEKMCIRDRSMTSDPTSTEMQRAVNRW